MQPKRSRAEWRQIVDRYQRSGLRPTEFARREGLNVHTFSWWRHEFRKADRRQEGRLTLVPVAASPVPEPKGLLLRFPDGLEMQVPLGTAPDWVGRVAAALR